MPRSEASRRPPFDDAEDEDDAMINADGENVDLYIPRKCSWTNRLITATDKGSVQMNIGHLDANGVYSGSYTTVALSGYVRSKVRERRTRTGGSLSTRATRVRAGVGAVASGGASDGRSRGVDLARALDARET